MGYPRQAYWSVLPFPSPGDLPDAGIEPACPALAPPPVRLPGKSHGWRSLVGCSPEVAKSRTRRSDFTLTFHFHALEKEMAPHSRTLAWKMPWTEEPGRLQSRGR